MLKEGNRVPLTADTVAELEESFAEGEANKGFFQEIKLQLEEAQVKGKNEIYLQYYQIKNPVAFMAKAEVLYKTKAIFDDESDVVKQEAWNMVRDHFSAMADNGEAFYIGKHYLGALKRCAKAYCSPQGVPQGHVGIVASINRSDPNVVSHVAYVLWRSVTKPSNFIFGWLEFFYASVLFGGCHAGDGRNECLNIARFGIFEYTPRTLTPSQLRDRAVKQVMRAMKWVHLEADRVLRGAARNLEYRRKSQLGLHAIIANIKSELFRRDLPELAPTNVLLLVIVNTVRTQHMSAPSDITAETAPPPSLGTATPLTMKAQSRKWQELKQVSDIVMSWPKLHIRGIVTESRMTQRSLVTSLVKGQSTVYVAPRFGGLSTNKYHYGALDAPVPAHRHDCGVCAAYFTSGFKLQNHYVNDHPDVDHMCPECGAISHTLTALDKHMRRAHGGGSRKGGRGPGWHGQWW
jgi:hypothetical protein